MLICGLTKGSDVYIFTSGLFGIAGAIADHITINIKKEDSRDDEI
jgi:hypothetical protein